MLVIATCAEWPDGNADLQTLSCAFNQAGIDCQLQPWQTILNNSILPKTIWPLAVWDYSVNPSAYQSFLITALAKGVELINSADLQRWNMHKSYLAELTNAGLPVIPTLYLEADKSAEWAGVLSECTWQNPVLKPVIGQSGKDVRRLHDKAVLPTLDEYPNGAIVQPFIDSITEHGELCLIYVAGKFSHAIRRTPANWRANSAYGVEISPLEPEKDWLSLAEKVLSTLPEIPFYARIDGLMDANNQLILNEVELIEPALYFGHAEGSIKQFISAFRDEVSYG